MNDISIAIAAESDNVERSFPPNSRVEIVLEGKDFHKIFQFTTPKHAKINDEANHPCRGIIRCCDLESPNF